MRTTPVLVSHPKQALLSLLCIIFQLIFELRVFRVIIALFLCSRRNVIAVMCPSPVAWAGSDIAMDHRVKAMASQRRLSLSRLLNRHRFENDELERLYRRYTCKLQHSSVASVVALFVVLTALLANLSLAYAHALSVQNVYHGLHCILFALLLAFLNTRLMQVSSGGFGNFRIRRTSPNFSGNGRKSISVGIFSGYAENSLSCWLVRASSATLVFGEFRRTFPDMVGSLYRPEFPAGMMKTTLHAGQFGRVRQFPYLANFAELFRKWPIVYFCQNFQRVLWKQPFMLVSSGEFGDSRIRRTLPNFSGNGRKSLSDGIFSGYDEKKGAVKVCGSWTDRQISVATWWIGDCLLALYS